MDTAYGLLAKERSKGEHQASTIKVCMDEVDERIRYMNEMDTCQMLI